jgi:hypothetical protein
LFELKQLKNTVYITPAKIISYGLTFQVISCGKTFEDLYSTHVVNQISDVPIDPVRLVLIRFA